MSNNQLRNLIKSSPSIYPFYINWIRRLNVDFPNNSTDLHLTGFPRSANTYCRELTKEVFPELNIVSHIHTVASLKKALKNNVTIVLLLRSPLSTTSSMLMKFDYKKEDEILYDYIKYHEFALRNIEKIRIFSFDEIIECPLGLISYIRSTFNVDISDSSIEQKLKIAERKSSDKEKTKNPLGSSRPNSQREERKDFYRQSIISHNLYSVANELYLKLRK